MRLAPLHPVSQHMTDRTVPSLPSKTSLWQADARYELGVGQFAFNGVTRDFDFPSFPSPEADARLPQLYVKRGETPYEKQLVAAGEEAWRDFVELREVAQKEVREEEEKRQDRAKGSMDDVIVTTLGTGSASPAQYRNGAFWLALQVEQMLERPHSQLYAR